MLVGGKHVLKLSAIPEAIYRFNAVAAEIPAAFFRAGTNSPNMRL